MDSSAADSQKEIACISNFSKLSQKTKQKNNKQENDYHSCEHFITYLLFFITFLKCKNSKESRNQSMLMPSKQSWI